MRRQWLHCVTYQITVGNHQYHVWQCMRGRKRTTLSGLIRLVISLECFLEITPDFLCPLMIEHMHSKFQIPLECKCKELHVHAVTSQGVNMSLGVYFRYEIHTN